jgi:hypothetical protein
MSVYLSGDFASVQPATKAIRDLKSRGFGPGDLAVFSDEPVLFPRGVLDRPSHMSLTAVLGAITFMLLATGFVYFAQHNYPLITGGMPIFSFWATGIITYEFTMFGATVSTFACFLWESGLIRKRDGAPVCPIRPERIHLRVRCNPNQTDEANQLLLRAGASEITRL